MSEQKIGIQKNLRRGPSSCDFPRFDPRPTSRVESSRAPNNGKPFRNKQQKEIARAEAVKAKTGPLKGTFVSLAYRQERQCV